MVPASLHQRDDADSAASLSVLASVEGVHHFVTLAAANWRWRDRRADHNRKRRAEHEISPLAIHQPEPVAWSTRAMNSPARALRLDR